MCISTGGGPFSSTAWSASCPSLEAIKRGCGANDCSKISVEDSDPDGKWIGSQTGLKSSDIIAFKEGSSQEMFGQLAINCVYKTKNNSDVAVSFVSDNEKYDLNDKWKNVCTAKNPADCAFVSSSVNGPKP